MEKKIAPKFHDFVVSFFSKDARIRLDGVKRLIALEKDAGGVKDDVDVADVADLSLVEELLRKQVFNFVVAILPVDAVAAPMRDIRAILV
jgi:hypothetical protein